MVVLEILDYSYYSYLRLVDLRSPYLLSQVYEDRYGRHKTSPHLPRMKLDGTAALKIEASPLPPPPPSGSKCPPRAGGELGGTYGRGGEGSQRLLAIGQGANETSREKTLLEPVRPAAAARAPLPGMGLGERRWRNGEGDLHRSRVESFSDGRGSQMGSCECKVCDSGNGRRMVPVGQAQFNDRGKVTEVATGGYNRV